MLDTQQEIVEDLKSGAGMALVIVALLFFVSGCAFTGNQSEAGFTSIEARAQELDKEGRVVKDCSAKVVDGKQRTKVSASGSMCGAVVTYSADEENAFQAFAIRAEVEKASIEAFGKVVPEVVDAAVTAGLKAFLGSGLIGAGRDAAAAGAALDVAKLKIEAVKATATR